MSIFNEAYLNEFFFNKKKKTMDNKNRKTAITKQEKKHGLITKEELEFAIQTVNQVMTKIKIFKGRWSVDSSIESYNKYLKNDMDFIRFGFINLDDLTEDTEEGDNARKNAGFDPDIMKFWETIDSKTNPAEDEICKKIKSKYKNIEFMFDGTSYGLYFVIISKKPKDDSGKDAD